MMRVYYWARNIAIDFIIYLIFHSVASISCIETCDDQYAHFDCGSSDYPYDCQNPDFAVTTSSHPVANEEEETELPLSTVIVQTNAPVATPNEEEETESPLSTVTAQTDAPVATPMPKEKDTESPSSTGISTDTAQTDAPVAAPTPEKKETYSPSSTVTPGPTTESTTTLSGPDLVLLPSDDATIVEEHPDDNYGNDSTLQIDDDSGTYDSLIRFDLSEIDTNSVAYATLRLFCTDGSDAGGIFGKTTASNWDEASVTWNSAPAAFGAPFHNLGQVQEATWYDIDVTDVFFSAHNSLNAVSIRITSKSWNRAGYSSKEGSDPPQLVVRMRENEVPLGSECPADTHLCSDGSVVSRVLEDGCNFAPCPHQPDTRTGLFFPVWRSGGTVACVDRASPPSWASGAYLKESKSDCCEAYSMLRVDECLRA